MLVLKQLPPFHAFPGLPGQDWVSGISHFLGEFSPFCSPYLDYSSQTYPEPSLIYLVLTGMSRKFSFTLF